MRHALGDTLFGWRYPVGTILACLLAAGANPGVQAAEITVKNDSIGGGGSVVIVGDFVPGEHAGARLTSPCDGTIVAVQVLWFEGTPGNPPSLERAIHIFDGGTFPTPGSELLLLEAPVLTPGFINEFRYVDEGQTLPISVPVKSGQRFYVTLEFDNPTDVGGGGASIVRDLNGCQAQKNVLRAIPGGWLNFCQFLAGDVAIRAVIDCPDPDGACCLTDGTCVSATEVDCTGMGGAFQGAGVACGSVTCPEPTGACCFEQTGGCLVLTPTNCGSAGGVFRGAGTDCTIVCFPEGACCLPDGSCLDAMTPEDCDAQNGVFQGDGTTCGAETCPEPEGACCFNTGFCLPLTEADCAQAGAEWMGFATDCTDADENGTADDCEQPPCPGDLDGDQDVDLIDLALELGAFGACVGEPEYLPAADTDGNGCVDLPDLSALIGAFGAPCQ
jgi:hypothetical protein